MGPFKLGSHQWYSPRGSSPLLILVDNVLTETLEIFQPEIFPLSIRAKGTSIGASSNWMNNFIVAFVVPPMINGIGWGMYLFFAALLLLGAVFIWFFVPESKNKSLEEMDSIFGSVTAAACEDQEILAAVRDEVGLSLLLAEGQNTCKGLSGENDKLEAGISTGHFEAT